MPRSTSGDHAAQNARSRLRLSLLGLCQRRGCGRRVPPTRAYCATCRAARALAARDRRTAARKKSDAAPTDSSRQP